MIQLPHAHYPSALALYRGHKVFFPLIAAVLAGEQEGVVYADRTGNPAQVYVQHAFGFAQIFGEGVPEFEESMRRYLLVDKAFSCPKVRLYTPRCPEFLAAPDLASMRSWRQRFRHDRASRPDSLAPQSNGLDLVYADARHVATIDAAFGVVRRFWRTASDFAAKSGAVLALVNGEAAALCYAAAIVDGKAEIDVMTLPAYRQLGLGKIVVAAFNERAIASDVLPLWDCFTNNAASMSLCRASGFIPTGDPYPFFTINR
jgi:GNAT superfamily N-acetyltransferase